MNPATAKRLQREGFVQIIPERGPNPVKHPTELPDIKGATKHPDEPEEPALGLGDVVDEPVAKVVEMAPVAKVMAAEEPETVDPEPSVRDSQTYTNRQMETSRPAPAAPAPSKLVAIPPKAKAPTRKKRVSKAEPDDGNILE